MKVNMYFYKLGMFHKCLVYEPETLNERSAVAVICIHSDGDYSDFPAGMALAEHGYRVLCGRVSRPEAALDDKLADIKAAVEAAKKLRGVEKVILLGHSGGATLMSLYQSVAEKGVGIYRGEKMITPIKDVGELPPADGILLIDSNWGNGVMTAVSVDPAVTDEESGLNLDPAYDVFNPANGFDPKGAHYGEEFKRKYLRAQAERVNRIIDRCLERLHALENHEGKYIDDEPFTVPGADDGMHLVNEEDDLAVFFRLFQLSLQLCHVVLIPFDLHGLLDLGVDLPRIRVVELLLELAHLLLELLRLTRQLLNIVSSAAAVALG